METLSIFKGCCLAPEFELDKSCVAFGSVILGCISKQRVVLHNKGDVGSMSVNRLLIIVFNNE